MASFDYSEICHISDQFFFGLLKRGTLQFVLSVADKYGPEHVGLWNEVCASQNFPGGEIAENDSRSHSNLNEQSLDEKVSDEANKELGKNRVSCSLFIKRLGRNCSNKAAPESEFCKTHVKKAQEGEAKPKRSQRKSSSKKALHFEKSFPLSHPVDVKKVIEPEQSEQPVPAPTVEISTTPPVIEKKVEPEPEEEDGVHEETYEEEAEDDEGMLDGEEEEEVKPKSSAKWKKKD